MIDISNIKNKLQQVARPIRFAQEKISSYFDGRILIVLILVVLACGMIYPHLRGAKATVYAGDDFIHFKLHISAMDNYDPDDLFKTSVEYAKFDCEHLGGRYSAMFLQSYLGINYKIRDLVKLRKVMSYSVLLYFLGIFMFIYSLMHNLVLKDKKIIDKLLAALATFLPIAFYHFAYFHKEVFAWFPGAMSYIVPIILSTISLSFSLFSLRKINIFNIILLVVSLPLAAASMGGTLAAVCLIYGICTLILVYTIVNRKLTLRLFISLATFYIFGIVNAMQPGNRNRRLVYMESEEILIKENFDTLLNMIRIRLDFIQSNYAFVIFFVALAVIASYFIFKNVNLNVSYASLALLSVFMPFASTLPIAIGYGTVIPLFDRTDFMIDLGIIIAFLNLIILACGIVSYLFGSILSRNMIANQISILAVLLLVVFMVVKNAPLITSDAFDSFAILDNMQQKRYEAFDEKYMTMFSELYEHMGEEKANIHYPKDEEVPPLVFFTDLYHKEYFDIKNIKKVYTN